MEQERKIRVYVAGRLDDMAVGYNKNRARMLSCALRLHRKGYSVFVPCMAEQMALLDGKWEYKDYFDNSQPWLLVSDAMYLVPGWEESKGTAAEIVTADKNGVPVFDNLKDLEKYFKEEENEKSVN